MIISMDEQRMVELFENICGYTLTENVKIFNFWHHNNVRLTTKEINTIISAVKLQQEMEKS